MPPGHRFFEARTCAKHFRQSGPNGLELEKETTPGIVRWPRVASMDAEILRAEVGQFNITFIGDEHVAALDVPMNNIVPVEVI